MGWLQNPRVQRALRLAAACCWATLSVWSLMPGSDRPHTGLSDNTGHMLAYFLAALVTRFAFRRIESRRQLLAFSCAAALVEVFRIWITGRQAGFDNWLASSTGAFVGIVLARTLVHSIKR